MNPIHWACLSRVGREILRIAYGFKSRRQAMFMKAATIAKMVGCTRVTVARWIALFKQRGWFRLKKRHAHFCEYDVSQVTVTPPFTSADTSQFASYLINSVAQRKPAQPTKKPRTNWLELERLCRRGVPYEEALRLAQEMAA